MVVPLSAASSVPGAETQRRALPGVRARELPSVVSRNPRRKLGPERILALDEMPQAARWDLIAQMLAIVDEAERKAAQP